VSTSARHVKCPFIVMTSVRGYDTLNSEPNNTGKWPLLWSSESGRTTMKRLDGAVETWATWWFWDRELIALSANIGFVVQRSVVAFGLQTEGTCCRPLGYCTVRSGRSGLTYRRQCSFHLQGKWPKVGKLYEGWNFNSANYLFTTDTK